MGRRRGQQPRRQAADFFHVHNASDIPIYETALPIPARPGEDAVSEFIGLVPPGQTIKRAAPEEWLSSYYSPEPVQIEFLDSVGWYWTRDEQGYLYRAPEQARPESDQIASAQPAPIANLSDLWPLGRMIPEGSKFPLFASEIQAALIECITMRSRRVE